ncbi:unnamed protein product [Tilletia controversa]|uniref:Alpha/beta hydrolase fold-3 domain-containing protein n=3 Tax=Tilletia TaxID=13289 RepID=A0A8X7MTG2_9BASI|nr:hypothetical protein CF336_g4070 [Tilletia laevis]KAE8247982.1 hypothetical protein A4X06_0g4048 [Tilletia controversa]KAE8261320.1 hypothetical protein A4X03_0g3357 [Tilletia caries]KAE8202896.1 hypothetical protein CF335_g3238 [Tilletia laevis]CAD6884609.1 unnamed protein product [Tilletia caries]
MLSANSSTTTFAVDSPSSASPKTLITSKQEMPQVVSRVPPPPLSKNPGPIIATSRWRLFKYHILAAILRSFCAVAPVYAYHKAKYGFPESTRVQKTSFPSRDKNRNIKAYIFRPSKNNALYQARLKAGNGKIPVHINMHGSGFVLPVLGTDCDFCGRLAEELGIVVIDSDYRKGPVYPFPAALQDVEDAVRYAQAEPEFDATKISLGGFSAGGNVALSASCTLNHAARAARPPSSDEPAKSVITAVATLYPACDLTVPPWMRQPLPHSEYDCGIMLPRWAMRFFHGSYCQKREHYADWRASPIRADESLFPPHVFIACGTADKLYEGADKLNERLQSAGHPDVTLLSLQRMNHGWDKVTSLGKPGWEERIQAYKGFYDTIRRGLGDKTT